jgi:hypothetical protein
VNSSLLKQFLDRKVKIDLQRRYVQAFDEEFQGESPTIRDFEKWAKTLRFTRNNYVTPNDAQEVLTIIDEA